MISALEQIKAENDASPDGPTKCFAVNPAVASMLHHKFLEYTVTTKIDENGLGHYQRRYVEIYPEPRMPVGVAWRIN